ncbi:MAG: hypothetical protein AAB875_06470, partial [Patescibacteria group bacterium]
MIDEDGYYTEKDIADLFEELIAINQKNKTLRELHTEAQAGIKDLMAALTIIEDYGNLLHICQPFVTYRKYSDQQENWHIGYFLYFPGAEEFLTKESLFLYEGRPQLCIEAKYSISTVFSEKHQKTREIYFDSGGFELWAHFLRSHDKSLQEERHRIAFTTRYRQGRVVDAPPIFRLEYPELAYVMEDMKRLSELTNSYNIAKATY